jgi:hypothetical protein
MTGLVAAVLAVLLKLSALHCTACDTDAAGDIESGHMEDSSYRHRSNPWVALGDATDVDVHLGTDLVVTTTYRRLDATGFQRYTWRVRTPENREAGLEDWSIYYKVRPGHDTGELWILDGDWNDRNDCGSVHLDRAAGRSRLTLYRACLGDPAWVKAGSGLDVFVSGRVYSDDARRIGLYGQDLRLGRRVVAS